MQVGFATVTLRQIKDLKKIVDVAEKVGADCIEWGADVHVRDIESARYAKQLCKDKNIQICSYGSYYRAGSNNLSQWKQVCEIASALGAKVVRIWLGSADSEVTDEATYIRLVEELRSMCAVAAEYGISVCPECHPNTYNNNTDAFLKIHKDTGCDNLGTYFQSLYKRQEYDLDRIERTKKYTECVHISYSEQLREQFPRYKPGYINSLLKKLSAIGYDKHVLIEFTYYSMQHGLVSCLKKDISKLKTQISKTK